MAIFKKKNPVVTPEVTNAVVEPETEAPAPISRAAKLYKSLLLAMPDVPKEAIVAEWASRSNHKVFPHQCPSAVAEAFFMHPHDEAVDWFERYVFTLDNFDDDPNTKVIDFAAKCKTRALPSHIQRSIDMLGVDETIERIAASFKDHEAVSTALRMAILDD